MKIGIIRVVIAGVIASGPIPVFAEDSPATEPSATQPSESTAESVKGAFADLTSRDPNVRAAALSQLMSLQFADLPLLQSAVRESRPLLPAQSLVLREIVDQVYLSGDIYAGNPASGFLGIRMNLAARSPAGAFRDIQAEETPSTPSGVVVVLRMPGFAGARMLRDGDVILSVLDRPEVSLRTQEDLPQILGGMGAGAVVHLQVLRQGEIIRVSVRLDMRPTIADDFSRIEAFLQARRLRSDEYWNAHFAPLIGDGVS